MENKDKKSSLEFGKIYRIGNFALKKYTKTLTGKQMRQIREEAKIPREMWKHLERTGVPFIKVQTIAGTWGIEWSAGTTFFDAFDDLPVNENGEFYGNGLVNATAIVTSMFADTSTVGDTEYQDGKIRLLGEYFDRMTADVKNEPSDEEEKENEKAADEVLANERHKATLIEMGKEVLDGSDRQADSED